MIKENIINKIKAYETIIIHRHVRPDPDALGSQCGLREILRETYPEKKIYAVGEDVESLTFLAEMDVIDDSVYTGALVIVCDTANTERICDQRYALGDALIKIDHHPNNDAYGDLIWVDTAASSSSEMIYELYLSAKDLPLKFNKAAARLIYGGIVGDTGRFIFPSTSNKTFQYAAELIDYDFDRTALYDGLYNVAQDITRLQGYILQNFTLSSAGVSSVKLTKEILDKFNVSSIDTGNLVGILGHIEGIKSWVFFIEEDDIIRVRLRSKGPVINVLAQKYNGGGHPMASGASVESWEEADALVSELEAICAEG